VDPLSHHLWISSLRKRIPKLLLLSYKSNKGQRIGEDHSRKVYVAEIRLGGFSSKERVGNCEKRLVTSRL